MAATPPAKAAPTQRHGGGRPRNASRDQVLRLATLQILAETGYDAMTVDAVAERAGAGKGAIYRRWAGKAELVADALLHAKPPLAGIDTGTLRGDLYALAAATTDIDSELEMQVIIGLTSALARDPDLRAAVRDDLIAPRLAAVHAIFHRAAERREIAPVRNPDLLVAMIPALIAHRTLLHGTAPGPDFARSIVDDVLLPLATGLEPTTDEQRSTR